MKLKRRVEVVIVSDVHLGAYGCQAKELLTYFNSIKPKTLVLNGNIINMRQFNRGYFPVSHLQVVKKIISLAANGTEVVYITGDHDDKLRKFSNSRLANVSIVDKLVLNLDGKTAWIFNGDVFDICIQRVKWLAKFGDYGFDVLIRFNSFVNWFFTTKGREKHSLYKTIKSNKKRATKHINDFENIVSDLAIKNDLDYVICGHTYQPKVIEKFNSKGHTTYLNSGDWVESLTALEYQFNRWKLYHYKQDKLAPFSVDEDLKDLRVKDMMDTVILENEKKLS